MFKELQRIAYHEAGHATAAHLLGGRIVGPVTIVPGAHYNGVAFVCSPRVPASDLKRANLLAPYPLRPARVRRSCEIDVMINLAGQCAEVLAPSVIILDSPIELETPDPVPVEALSLRDEERLASLEDGIARANDFEKARATASGLVGRKHAPLLVELLFAETQAFAGTHLFQRHCRPLAELLLAHRTLSARAVRSLLKGISA